MAKICISCKRELDIYCFYTHSKMRDGHLNKCKDCCKRDNKNNRSKKIEYYKSYDRNRDTLVRKSKRKIAELELKQKDPDFFQKRKTEYNRKWRMKNKEKVNAHRLVMAALSNGVLIKSLCCDNCGEMSEVIEGHHEDYSKPLEVIWLCDICHKKRHVELNEIKRNNG